MCSLNSWMINSLTHFSRGDRTSLVWILPLINTGWLYLKSRPNQRQWWFSVLTKKNRFEVFIVYLQLVVLCVRMCVWVSCALDLHSHDIILGWVHVKTVKKSVDPCPDRKSYLKKVTSTQFDFSDNPLNAEWRWCISQVSFGRSCGNVYKVESNISEAPVIPSIKIKEPKTWKHVSFHPKGQTTAAHRLMNSQFQNVMKKKLLTMPY